MRRLVLALALSGAVLPLAATAAQTTTRPKVQKVKPRKVKARKAPKVKKAPRVKRKTVVHNSAN